MTESSASREPTMEEILASIRRIIENTDISEDEPERAAANDRVSDPFVSGVGSSDRDQAFEPGEDADEIAAGSRETEVERPAAATISLADVAARIRATGAAVAPRTSAMSLSRPAAATQGNAAVRFDDSFEVFESTDSALVVAEEPSFVPVVEPALQSQADAKAIESDPFYRVPEQGEDDPEAALMETELASALREAEAPARRNETDWAGAMSRHGSDEDARGADPAGMQLMSAAAGAKVTAAFEDLNEAVTVGPRRSFDEIAEEMLRPMLQQWLDDNLPTLVERLVREEIERVARGGRR